mgnify:CR=1 FL=1
MASTPLFFSCGLGPVAEPDLPVAALAASVESLSPWVVALAASVLAATLAMAAVFLLLRRHASEQRLQAVVNGLEERLFPAKSPEDILKALREVLPNALAITDVNLFLYDAPSHMLKQITIGDQEAVVCPVEGPVAPSLVGLTLCFRNRTLLAVDDVKREGLKGLGEPDEAPGDARRAVLYAPMFAAGELTGVLELAHSTEVRRFRRRDRLLAQHLANQIAARVALLDREAVREKLFRGDQMAAAGRLMSDLADELSTPLESIERRIRSLLTPALPRNAALELEAIAADAAEGARSVKRLRAPARAERAEVALIDIRELLGEALRHRRRDCEARGIEVKTDLPEERVPVLAVRADLEQALLNLLVEAQRSAAEAEKPVVSVRLYRTDRHAVVEVVHLSKPGRHPGPASVKNLSLAVASAIARSFGGVLRQGSPAAGYVRCELELPLSLAAAGSPAPAGGQKRALTALVVAEDGASASALVALLGARGHRAVPLKSADDVAGVAGRLRLDAVFCSAGLSGNSWTSLYERIRRKVALFVVVTPDAGLSGLLGGDRVRTLAMPVREEQLDQLLAEIAAPRAGAAANGC